MANKKPVTVRISEPLVERLIEATNKKEWPYAPTITQVVERGIELALKELADINNK